MPGNNDDTVATTVSAISASGLTSLAVLRSSDPLRFSLFGREYTTASFELLALTGGQVVSVRCRYSAPGSQIRPPRRLRWLSTHA